MPNAALSVPPSVRRWQALATDHRRDRAIATALDIADELAHAEVGPGGPGVSGGSAGLAQLFLQLNRCGLASDLHLDALDRCLAHCTSDTDARVKPEALFSGFVGIGTALDALDERTDDGDSDDLRELDQYLLASVSPRPWPLHFDVINGLSGVGVYAAQRSRYDSGRALLREVARSLRELAEVDERGCRWFTRPELLSDHQRGIYPGGQYNLGVAHGVPGPLAILATAHALGLDADANLAALAGGLRWLMSHVERDCSIPYAVGPNQRANQSRYAWCYGTPGIAGTLSMIGALAPVTGASEIAEAMLHATTRLDPAAFGVFDAGLCHGSAGIALIYARAWHRADRPELAAAAVSWLDYTLRLRRDGLGCAGYLAHQGADKWAPESGVLTGSAGIALSLLALATDVEPDWDWLLLLSSPCERR